MASASVHPVVHLELLALDWGKGIEGGVVEHDAERAMWLRMSRSATSAAPPTARGTRAPR
jgi:hypothetical protein